MTMLRPQNLTELSAALVRANAGNAKVEGANLRALNRVLQYTPEDMVVTAEAGMTLAALQTELGRHGQWLPLDPPQPEKLTLAGLIDQNLSGPRRFAFGTVRDHLIGIKVMLADGTLISSGGKVVKNVAGYDLAKLFIGAGGSLGVVVETTFKLRPLPEMEQFVEAACASLRDADRLIEAVIRSEVTPAVLDLHNMAVDGGFTVVLGFAGTREEVDWQLEKVREIGFTRASSLDYEVRFWKNDREENSLNPGHLAAHRLSVLPSKLADAVVGLKEFVARAGNGVIYYRGEARALREKLPLELMRRLKDAYDPRHILPELPL